MDAPAFFAGIVAGGAVGGTVAWLASAARARMRAEPALLNAEAGARAAAAMVEELRRQVASWRDRADGMDAQLRKLGAEKAAGEARAAAVEQGLEEQARSFDESKRQLADTFAALAAESLERNSEGFLRLANQKLSAARQEGASELAAREQAIAALVHPVRESLDRFDHKVHALEQARGEAYVRLTEQVRALAEGQRQLQSGTDDLVNALRAPAVRGRWGEIQLRRVLEMAGMIDHCDFVEQATVVTSDGRLRPDVVVRLPGGKTVVIDAKAPLGAFLAARDAKTDDERSHHMRRHAEQVRAHVGKLAAKSYWADMVASPELVVMFLPGDTFYTAALEEMPDLLEQAVANRVLIATPMTLMGLLRAVHVGWKQERLAQNAEEISRCGRELHERIAKFSEHIAKMGGALGRSVEHFNEAVGSLQMRVLPGARRLEELGAGGRKELEELAPIDARPRELVAVPSTDGRPALSVATSTSPRPELVGLSRV